MEDEEEEEVVVVVVVAVEEEEEAEVEEEEEQEQGAPDEGKEDGKEGPWNGVKGPSWSRMYRRCLSFHFK